VEVEAVPHEEVERILRQAQERCRDVLAENRNGLDLVARALLEHETIDGTEVTRLLELARAGSTSGSPSSVIPSSPRGLDTMPDPSGSVTASPFGDLEGGPADI